METSKIKELGAKCIVIGGGILAAGIGLYSVGYFLENYDLEQAHKEEMLKIKQETEREKTNRETVYAERIKNMDEDSFAKYYAERVAKANDDVVAEANKVKDAANRKMTQMKIDLGKTVKKLEAENQRKLDAEIAKKNDILEKYEALEKLFKGSGSGNVISGVGYSDALKAVLDSSFLDSTKSTIVSKLKKDAGEEYYKSFIAIIDSDMYEFSTLSMIEKL